MRVSPWTKLYIFCSFILFVCLLSVPIFAQNSTEGSAESTEALRPVLALCELAEATEESTAEATAEATEEADCVHPDDIAIWYINTSGNANARVRECPDTSCDVILHLPFASAIRVFATEGAWHSILLDDGTVAYIAVSVTSTWQPQAPVVDNNDSSSDSNATPDPNATSSGDAGGTSGSSSGGSSGSSGGSGGGSTSGGGGGGGGGITATPTRAGDPND